MSRAAALVLVLAACSKSAAPAPSVQPQRCPPGAYRVDDPSACLELPPQWHLTAREKRPAFDDFHFTFEGPDADGPDLVVDVFWYARPQAIESDYHAAEERLAVKSPAVLLARGPTDDGNGAFVAYQEPNAQGPVFRVRSEVRSGRYRASCSASSELKRREELERACRSLSAPP